MMFCKKLTLPLGLFVLFVISCVSKNESRDTTEDTLFQAVDLKTSKIEFANNVIENDTLNYFTFPYLYLGGGVSIGDINNDGLSDIYFTGNMVPNKLYLNKGNLVFEDITATAGLSGDQRWYTGSTMADVNNDGFLDIYVGVSEIFGNSANQLFINNGDNTFTEQAEAYGLADESTSIQSTFFDYDNDGLLDFFVANYPLVPVSQGNWFYHGKMESNLHTDSGHLYKNNGDGTFKDVTNEVGVRNFGLTLGVVASDFNNDGYKDLYLSNDFNVPDYLYLNNGDGTFSEITKKAMRHTSMFGMGADAADFNNDGLQDILQVDMTSEDYKRSKTNMASMNPASFDLGVELGFHYQYMQNSLQVNNGIDTEKKPQFSDISRLAGLATTDWSWGGLFADFDNDGFKDVFVTNGVKRDVNNNDVLASYREGVQLGGAVKKDYRELPSTPISNYAFRNNGDFTFTNTTQGWGFTEKGFSNGFAYSDLDNDGDLDLVINNLNAVASVYENKSIKNHFLKVKLKGPAENPFGFGAKVTMRSGKLEQNQELTTTRGYQSSVDPVLNFGLGSNETIDTLEVLWPDGKSKQLLHVNADQLVEIEYSESALVKEQNNPSATKKGFKDITNQYNIDFVHVEDKFDDYVFEPLLPHKYSRLGPALTVGDINADGLDDFFVGNSKKNAAVMYTQTPEGSFVTIDGPWQEDQDFEDTGALFFDADNDGDLDLYVVSGGNHKLMPKRYYQDRLYINTPSGYIKGAGVLPEITSSGLKVICEDYDNDGDLDLFVGGRIVPGKYPYPAKSYLLRNDGGKDASLKFTDVTSETCPAFEELGLITSALWDDFDNDGRMDLIVAGEWTSIRFFRNLGSTFEEVTSATGLEKFKGWWYGLEKIDMDADGDMDYLAGNLGLNYKYHATDASKFEVYANDFDKSGTNDIVLSYEKEGVKLPLRGRECSSQQVPMIKKRFETYKSFANANLLDIYGEQMLENALNYSANTFASYWIENVGNAQYKMHELPNRAQFSSINTFQVFDYDGDAYPDVFVGGNLYTSEVETPRNDAGLALVLKSNGKSFEPVAQKDLGLFIDGEIRDIAAINLGKNGKKGYLVAINNDRLRLIGEDEE